MLTAKAQLLAYTRRWTLIGALLGLIVTYPYAAPLTLVGLSLLFAVVFRFTFHGIYESLIYTTPDFYDFMRKIKWEQGLPSVWNPIVSRRLKRSSLMCFLLVLTLAFPVFFVWRLGHFPILPLLILVGCTGYTNMLCRLQRVQGVAVLQRAKNFEGDLNQSKINVQ